MGRVTPVSVEVLVDDDSWMPGVVRTCEVDPDGSTCTAIVSFGGSDAVTTGRFPAAKMRKPSGEPGCPALHQDETCCGLTGAQQPAHGL